MRLIRCSVIAAALVMLSGCAANHDQPQDQPDHAILWAAYAAEYQAVSAQTYATATRDLPRFIADTSWSALPNIPGLPDKPPAVILDVDETIVSGVDMELTLVPFDTVRQYEWGLVHQTIPIRGVTKFVNTAQDLGVAVFLVTNRPCETRTDVDHPCPQEQGVIDLVAEIGIQTDADHVMLVDEQADWGKEKSLRRELIAETHRVVILVGDDYGDFVHCSRAEPVAPCATAATRDSRDATPDTYESYWGNGWYIKPSPMY